jgi:TRAP-type transport system small permease protein
VAADLFRRLDDGLARLEDLFLMLAMATIATLVGLGVVLRYVFNSPLVWSEEFIITLFVWMLMIGIAAALRSHMHIRIDALVMRIGGTGRRALGVLALAASTVITIGAIYAGIAHTAGVWSSTTPMLGFSMGWIFLSLPVGFSMMLLHMARLTLDGGAESVLRNQTESVIETATQP